MRPNKAPRRKQRGINYALIIRWLSASLRPKERGIKPAEMKCIFMATYVSAVEDTLFAVNAIF